MEVKIIGKSQRIKDNLEFIKKIADTNKTILIIGETGTGKELTVKKIHELSWRKNYPFIAINCASFPESLFEAELCGFERGAFTGAFKSKPGLLELAKEGTLFLDEIGELSLTLQVKLLRIIEGKEFRRIGDTESRQINARFIFATNKNLQEEVKSGNFRKDLYYRINVVRLYIPPLKERKSDIPLLVNHFLEVETAKSGIPKVFSTNALKKLIEYDFPGNIRELVNIIERACLLSQGKLVRETDVILDSEFSNLEQNHTVTPQKVRSLLEKNKWNKTKTARELGKSRRQFYRLLKKLNMDDCIQQNPR